MGSYIFDYDGYPGEPDNQPLKDCSGGLSISEVADIDAVTRQFTFEAGKHQWFQATFFGEGIEEVCDYLASH